LLVNGKEVGHWFDYKQEAGALVIG
jgi:hypothetical protein